MKHIRAALLLTLSISVLGVARAQPRAEAHSPFDELLAATRFMQNYKEVAATSARVFGTRAQGSDREYAAFMAKVAEADLTDLQACLSKAYAAGPLTAGDAEELVKIFRSPIGMRLVDLNQRMVISDIERGFHKPLDPSVLSDSERRELALIYQREAMTRYNAFIAGQARAVATRACVASSKVGKESGGKF